jgi:hypothetical protein
MSMAMMLSQNGSGQKPMTLRLNLSGRLTAGDLCVFEKSTPKYVTNLYVACGSGDAVRQLISTPVFRLSSSNKSQLQHPKHESSKEL